MFCGVLLVPVLAVCAALGSATGLCEMTEREREREREKEKEKGTLLVGEDWIEAMRRGEIYIYPRELCFNLLGAAGIYLHLFLLLEVLVVWVGIAHLRAAWNFLPSFLPGYPTAPACV